MVHALEVVKMSTFPFLIEHKYFIYWDYDRDRHTVSPSIYPPIHNYVYLLNSDQRVKIYNIVLVWDMDCICQL